MLCFVVDFVVDFDVDFSNFVRANMTQQHDTDYKYWYLYLRHGYWYCYLRLKYWYLNYRVTTLLCRPLPLHFPLLYHFPSFPFRLSFPSLPLEIDPLKTSWEVLRSAVSSHSGVWGKAPARIEFGAFFL